MASPLTPNDPYFQRNEEVRKKHGSPTFYALLDKAAIVHDKKSHDYASNDNPSGNYHFAGLLANLFAHSSHDAGFIGRIGEKIYRLANLEKAGKIARNESLEDTEDDIVVITALWMADRRDRRTDAYKAKYSEQMEGDWNGPSNEQTQLRLGLDKNPLQTELFDLIKLMPDKQVDELINYVRLLRQARAKPRQDETTALDIKARKSL